MESIDVLMHPVRLRIIHALHGGSARTTGELCERMPDVAKATMYRHVSALVAARVLEVAEEQRVHSVIERRYRLREARTAIDADTVATMSPDDHRRLFGVAMASILAEFYAYLDREGADPVADKVNYPQATIWLDDAERDAFIAEMAAVLRGASANRLGNGRKPYFFSAAFFPGSAGDSGQNPH